jgi:hypothetical protein
MSFLPDNFAGISANDFYNIFYRGSDVLVSTYNFINNIFPIDTLFLLVGVVIFAEVLKALGFNGIKYIIKLIRG